jgi:hypothetical protein
MASAAMISAVESRAVDRMMPDEAFISNPEIPTSLVLPIYDQAELCSLLCERAQDSQFMMSVGSTNAWTPSHMIDDDESTDGDVSKEPLEDDTASDELLAHLADMDGPLHAEIDLDDFMVSAAHAKIQRNVQAEHLSKI